MPIPRRGRGWRRSAPRIAAAADARLAALAGEGHRLALYEATLLVESGRWRDFDGLIVVTASTETQIARAMARDGLSRAQAEARLRAQLPTEEKVRVATHVIDNDGAPRRDRSAGRRAAGQAAIRSYDRSGIG